MTKRFYNWLRLTALVAVMLSAQARAEAEAINGIMSGLAGIAGGAATIGAAAAAAAGDVGVANINAAKSVTETLINAGVTKDTNQTNAIIELNRNQTNAQVAAITEKGKTEREGMLSAERTQANKDLIQSQREKNWMDYQYNVGKLLADDKARTEELELKREQARLEATIEQFRNRGPNGGLQITRFDSNTGDRGTSNNALVASTDPVSELGNGTAQERLTRAVSNSQNSMAQRLSRFRGAKKGAAVSRLPEFLSASATLARNNPIVRGSFSTRLLSLPERQASLAPISLRAVRPSYPGAAHGKIGRNSEEPSGGHDGHHH